MSLNYPEYIKKVISIAEKASLTIIDIYKRQNYLIREKLDNSPVTEADLEAHSIIQAGLQSIDNTIPIISEEGSHLSYEERKNWKRYWLVDPLDGTEEFINKTNEFTINIALIEDHVPVLGLVYIPYSKQCYWAIRGDSSYFQDEHGKLERLKTKNTLDFPIKIAISRRASYKEERQNLLNRLGNYEIIYQGSALKICLVAHNKVDLYPRFGPTSEWDTAAGQCILETAGGFIVDLSLKPLQYNTHMTLINPPFMAVNSNDLLTYIVDKSI